MLILQLLLCLFAPYLFIRLARTTKIGKWLSPVVMAYLLGMILANLPFFRVNTEWAKHVSEGAIVLAIPLLLFSTDLRGWLSNARTTILSFICCLVAGVASSVLAAYWLNAWVEESWRVSAMLVGVYTGGTPNLQAIGLALDAPENTYILLNAADIFCSGIYLILLTSVLHPLLGYLLPSFIPRNLATDQLTTDPKPGQQAPFTWKNILVGLGAAILVLALSFLLWWLLSNYVNQTAFLMLMLTTLSVLASLLPSVRQLPGTFETGDYLLLVFCIAVGMLSDFSQLLAQGGGILQYTAVVIVGAILLHYLLAMLFRLDRDTTMIISTASIFGPAFVGQVASAIGNRELIFSGMATGVMGYAVGNYLGLAVAYFLH